MSSAPATPHESAGRPESGAPFAGMPIRPAPRYSTTAFAALAAILLASLLWSLATNHNMEWPVVGQYLFSGLTLRGVLVTLYLTVIAVVIGFAGGVVLASMQLADNWVLRAIAGLYTTIFRGVPLLVQILFWGYLGALYPTLALRIPFTGITLVEHDTNSVIGAMTAAILALGLNEIAYAAEIIRGGILGVDTGQTEAAYSLGISPRSTMSRIVLPQAMRTVIPPFGNEVITMLKTTSLVSVIAGNDLLTNLQTVYGQTYQVIPLLVVASIWYCALTTILGVPQRALERRYGRGFATVR
ncbi:amino acid ABC transporter permease [Kribbella solani]|uniref:Polar amino acid transport system permease protein n=1 Tax=Kribbella solani TaxID=236067 RepID=A0A841DQF6_9ACTN|nr:amino acid ABC transporter permease [Kribbella solani]MBB5980883.1 polar amino acid transport system permease protein [Kribbella solani]